MKKIYLILSLLFTIVYVNAQTNVQLHYDFGKDRSLTSTVENFTIDTYGSTYLFVDMYYNIDAPTMTYFEFVRELQFWKAPLSLHIEYNGGLNYISSNPDMQFSITNAYLIGGTYTYANDNFNITTSVMYKYIKNNPNPNNFQLTSVWNWNINDKFAFNGFVDFWKENKLSYFGTNYVFITEPVLWYNINKSLSVGSEVEISSNIDFVGMKVFPTLAIKYTL